MRDNKSYKHYACGMRAVAYCLGICLMLVSTLFIVTSCASIGNPDGGRYDEEPPVVVKYSPELKALNNTKKKIDILFNEYIKLDNPNDKVVISPPQIEMPNIRAAGKRVKVDLYDSLQANTTYTIDFGDAILDNNEGNPMGQFTYSFSTGSAIDTMEVNGTVLMAENLEPIKGIMVGLYPADSLYDDSLFTTKPFMRVSRTNSSGQFSIKGVKNGSYRVFALKDMDGNYAYNQRSETVAFDTTIVVTSSKPDIRPDTIWTDSTHIEKIVMVPYIHYYPDNLVLKAFVAAGQDKHLLKTEYKEPGSFKLFFTAPQDSLPIVRGLNFDADTQLIPEPSLKNDTIIYWVRDTAVAHMDTLSIELTYLDTDTLGVDVYVTDTLNLVPKMTWAKMEKQRKQKSEDWEKAREKRAKRSKKPLPFEENPFEHFYLKESFRPNGSIAPNQNPTLSFNVPIESVDTTKIHLYLKVDSDYVDEPFIFEVDEYNMRDFHLYAEWEPKATYKFVADSLAFTSVTGLWNKSIKNDIRVKSDEEFGTFYLTLVNADDSCVVQLLNRSDKVVQQEVTTNGRVDFYYLRPGDYYLRMFVDRNGNETWDTGDYATGLQPEEMFYFPKVIPIKAYWEMSQSWNYRSIPWVSQKPMDITKQKPDKQRTIQNRNAERAAQWGK